MSEFAIDKRRLRYFLRSQVFIAVVKPGQPPGILTIGDFLTLFTVLSRYSDMLILAKSKIPEGHKDECAICLESDAKMFVLPCSHRLCSRCYERWVSRRLNCPYCRHTYRRKSVGKCRWEMLEWQSEDVEKDLRHLESKLGRFWTTLEYATTSPELLEAYEASERTIRVREEEGVVIVD